MRDCNNCAHDHKAPIENPPCEPCLDTMFKTGMAHTKWEERKC